MSSRKNNVVKITITHDGSKKINPKWCLIDPCNDQGRSTLCTKEFFGYGESSAVYKVKVGAITCEKCKSIIMIYKSITT